MKYRERALFTGARASTPGLLEGRPLRSLSLMDNQLSANSEPRTIIHRSISADPAQSSSESSELDSCNSDHSNITSNARTDPNFILQPRIIEENEELISPAGSPGPVPRGKWRMGDSEVSPSHSVSDKHEESPEMKVSPVSDQAPSATEGNSNSVCEIVRNGILPMKSNIDQNNDSEDKQQGDQSGSPDGQTEGTYVCTLTVNNGLPTLSHSEREETKFWCVI